MVFLTAFLDLVGFGLIIPIQPFLAQQFGASPIQVTWLGASFSLMQFVFAPFWGKLSDRFGRRKILLTTISISSLGYLIFAFAPSLTVLFAARILAGFGAANLGTLQAIIADVTPPEERSKGMGLIGAAFGLGFVFGPALGGGLSAWGLQVPVFAASGLALLNLILAYCLVPETREAGAPVSHHRRAFSFASVRAVGFRRAEIGRLLVVILFYGTAFSMMEQVLGLFIEAHWTQHLAVAARAPYAAKLTAAMLIVVGVATAFTQGYWIGKLTPKLGEKKVLVIGIGLVAASLIAIPFAPGLPFLSMLGIGVVLAVGAGMVSPSSLSLLSQAAKKEEQGEVLGVGQSLSALGRVFGPAVAGVFFTIAPGMPFLVGSALVLFCIVFALGVFSRSVGLDRMSSTQRSATNSSV